MPRPAGQTTPPNPLHPDSSAPALDGGVIQDFGQAPADARGPITVPPGRPVSVVIDPSLSPAHPIQVSQRNWQMAGVIVGVVAIAVAVWLDLRREETERHRDRKLRRALRHAQASNRALRERERRP